MPYRHIEKRLPPSRVSEKSSSVDSSNVRRLFDHQFLGMQRTIFRYPVESENARLASTFRQVDCLCLNTY